VFGARLQATVQSEAWACIAAQERFYFGDTVLPLFESGIPLLRERLAKLDDKENVTIAYPDEGAWKRFKYQFDEYPEAGLRRPLISFPLCVTVLSDSRTTRMLRESRLWWPGYGGVIMSSVAAAAGDLHQGAGRR